MNKCTLLLLMGVLCMSSAAADQIDVGSPIVTPRIVDRELFVDIDTREQFSQLFEEMKKLLESLEEAARTQSAADAQRIAESLDDLESTVSERLRAETVPTVESLNAAWTEGLWADAYQQLLRALARARDDSARSSENLALLVGEVREYTATTQEGMKRQWQPDKGTIMLFLFLLVLVLLCIAAILQLKHRILVLHRAAQQAAYTDRAVLVQNIRTAMHLEWMRMPRVRINIDGKDLDVSNGQQ